MDVLHSLLLAVALAQVDLVVSVELWDLQCSPISLSSETPIYFKSPGRYPYNYPNNHDSCWVVTSDVEDMEPRIRVTFSAIEALLGLTCSTADYLEVRDGDNYNSTLLLRWCGWGHPSTPFVSSNDSLYVYFHTDSSISYGGFEMKAYINETAHAISSSGDSVTLPPSLRPRQRGGQGRGRGQQGSRGQRGQETDTNEDSQTFNNDQQSRNSFNNNVEKNLATSQSSKDTGMIAGIVIGVLLGVTGIGVGIYFLAKCYTDKNKPPWNPLDNVIIPKRRRRKGFDNLQEIPPATGDDAGATGGGTVSVEVAIPRPMVLPPLNGPHPPPGPVAPTGVTKPHPGLVFANYSNERPLPGIGETNSDFSTPDATNLVLAPTPAPALAPALTPATALSRIAPAAQIPTEPPLSGITLMTTKVTDAPSLEVPGSGMTDISADHDVEPSTPRSGYDGASHLSAMQRNLPSLELLSPSVLPPLRGGVTFSPTSSGLVPVPPTYSSNVSLPPAYNEESYS